MSIYEKINIAMDNNDVNAYAELLHDDFKFVRHASNSEMSKSDWVNVISSMMESGKITRTNSRCIYENDDILVEHRISTYTDGERSATMLVHLKKDGLLWRTETGVTPLTEN